jgi:plasmid stability protein
MAQLIVRNLENEVKEKLRRRAKRHGRSMEAEVRDILRDATKDEGRKRKGLGTEIVELFQGIGGLKPGEEIEELRGFEPQIPKFEE